MSQVARRLPEHLKTEVLRLSEADGVSPDDWVTLAIAEKIEHERTVAGFRSRARAAGVTPENAGERLKAILRQLPDRPPDPGDALPPEFAD